MQATVWADVIAAEESINSGQAKRPPRDDVAIFEASSQRLSDGTSDEVVRRSKSQAATDMYRNSDSMHRPGRRTPWGTTHTCHCPVAYAEFHKGRGGGYILPTINTRKPS